MSLHSVLSLRIVVADYYMTKPISGLDTCYCEFRGKEIKKVPIIRIFGSTADGKKTCMHIHGVFPYFYIPHEGKDVDINKQIYLLCSSVDKAINISLGQSNSQMQHVFKIQLVKGIPFYGFHKKEHQYLKVYMFNPKFVKRAANLFQNGAILGRIFQPNECHVPYVQQFHIDYNLFPMSFLHVPSEIVKYRSADNEEYPTANVSQYQILDSNVVSKMSTCVLEIDVGAKFILNRFQGLSKKTSQHSNPGIESIWQDEKRRRENMSMEMENIPPLEVPISQERTLAKPTESDIFYRRALSKKLEEAETSINQTVNSTILSQTNSVLSMERKETKRKFDLKKLLLNSVYPEECSQETVITNASFVEDHLPGEKTSNKTLSVSSNDGTSDQDFLDETIVDEDMVISLSQPETQLNLSLHQQDFELLDVMKQLEENDDNGCVDLDSSLAPLSQSKCLTHMSDAIAEDDEADSDTENFNYTIVMEDLDEIIRLSEEKQTTLHNGIPQLDGGDDLLNTPKKNKRNIASPRTPRTPRTPRSKLPLNRFAPLQILTTNKSAKKNTGVEGTNNNTSHMPLIAIPMDTDSDVISVSSEDGQNTKRAQRRQNLESNGVSIRDAVILSSENESDQNCAAIHPKRKTRSSGKTLDMTHVTCNLKTPRRKRNEEKPLVYYDIRRKTPEMQLKITNDASNSNDLNGNLDKGTVFKTNVVNDILEEFVESPNLISQSSVESGIQMNNVAEFFDTDKIDLINSELQLSDSNNLTALKTNKTQQRKINLDKLGEPVIVEEIRHENPPDEANQIYPTVFGQQNNIVPQTVDITIRTPEMPNVKQSVIVETVASKSVGKLVRDQTSRRKGSYCSFLMPSQAVLEHDERFNICPQPGPSGIRYNSVTNLDIDTDPAIDINCSPVSQKRNDNCGSSKFVVITPTDFPPSYEDVDKNCLLYGIEEHKYIVPFYGNNNDVTSRKEIGHTVLSIQGNSLNDLETFKCTVPGVRGITELKSEMLVRLGGIQLLNQLKTNSAIREFFASNNSVIISPLAEPPTHRDAKMWLKAKECINMKTKLEEDSPIKITRKKMINVANFKDTTDVITTPPSTNSGDVSFIAGSDDELICTPKNSNLSMKRRISRTNRLTRSTKNRKYSEVKYEPEKSNRGLPAIACHNKGSQESTNSSNSISNDTLLAEMDNSSFVHILKNFQNFGQSDVSFGLSAASLNNTFGFKVDLDNLQQAKSDVEHNYLTTLNLEIFAPSRGDLKPNPQLDPIVCVFYSIVNSEPKTTVRPSEETGIILVDECEVKTPQNSLDAKIVVHRVDSEIELFSMVLELCRRWDPDIYTGYEIEMSSWGYIMDRAKTLALNIGPLLSRVPSEKCSDFIDEDKEQFTDLDFETKLCGRILLDVWRLLRSEIALTSYTFENVMFHILHRRVPLHSNSDLTMWFSSNQTKWIVLEYFLERVKGTLQLLDQLDLIGRTSEMAKLIGIQFYEVLSRGSQFRVESMMLRIAKPKNLVPLSPSVQQRAHMRAPEYLPLILEPQSRFYADPLIVLDFQSLYPSVIMAYNYCYSTCLGRVEHLGSASPYEFGASQLKTSPSMLKYFVDNDFITVSPCGAVFVTSEIREGIIPRMLKEILDTRQMVKQSMKIHKGNSALQRILHSRQLGLKLMANVTYGYTAANFSGRMPCVEVGDSVVAKGRETLERAIKLVENSNKWRAKVVYGDTDSLFVLLPGRSKEDAFRIGEEIADAVTQDNPQPVKLKMEKVYLPCILQMLEKCLRILFGSRDVSIVKKYVCRQFTKLLTGRANLQDLIFAKEFRGLNGYKPTACVPALELTRRWIQSDPRNIPRRGERVPFVIINGPPGVPLIRLVRSPIEVLADEGLKINAMYYISKAIIPPLNRCFLLIGADVNEWFAELPRKMLITPALSLANEVIAPTTNASKKSTISQYFSSSNCMIDCGNQTKSGICSECLKQPQKCVVILSEKMAKLDRSLRTTEYLCQSCCGRIHNTVCRSMDCPVLFVLELKNRENKQISYFDILLNKYF